MRRPGLHFPSLVGNADLSLRRALTLALGIPLSLLALRQIPSVDSLDTQLSRTAEFNVRHRLRLDPPLDPRIAIFGYGDSSVNELKKEGLSLADWAVVFRALAASHPRAILVDKVFSAPDGADQAPAFVAALKDLPVPIIAGAFVSQSPISNRPLLPTQSLASFLERPGNLSDETSLLDWLPIESGYPYGPIPEIREGFAHIGHILYSGDLTMRPIVRLSRYDLFPAAGLFTAKQFGFRGGELYADGHLVPIDGRGKVVTNLSSPGSYYDRTFRLSTLLAKARAGKPIELPKDAIVMLLPALYTGSTDLQPSPFGILPGGYFVTAFVNSVITGQWIRTATWTAWLLPLFGLVAYALFLIASGPVLALGVGATALAIATGGLAAFVGWGLELPWLCALLCLVMTALALVVENARLAEDHLASSGEAEKDFSLVMDSLRLTGASIPSDGVRFGRYHVLEVIGSGGMGEVYRAKTHGAGGFQKEFAIKRILAGQRANVDTLKLFEEEARLNSILTHANIAQVFEFLRMKDTYLMVMEFIAGKNLAQLIDELRTKEIRLPLPLSVQIVDEICKGLDYVHSKRDPKTNMPLNLTHRDVSPQNVMLSYEGAVKLIDFGIAKGKLNSELTAAGVIKGKFAYMSPEQSRGAPVDRRSDLFSVGLILYELVTGTRVFQGGTDIETIENVRECRIPPAALFNPDLPRALERILANCLTKEPDRRYPDAGALRHDLQDFLETYPRTSLEENLSKLLATLFLHRKGETDPGEVKAPSPADIPTKRLVG